MLIAYLAITPLLITSAYSLQCHTGYSLIKGSTIGEATKECGKETDYCYNATAQVFSFSKLQKAGCNTMICQFIPDGCQAREILGVPVIFCCCRNEDFCNRGNMTGVTPLAERGAAVLKEMVNLFD